MRAPPASAFAAVPRGWYVLADTREIRDRPVARDLPFGRVVVWRHGGGLAATAGRCWHMNADLGGGHVEGGRVVCPFHGWAFGPDGRCATHPDAALPAHAAAEVDGRVLVHADPDPPCPPPSFGVDVVSAPPFGFGIDCPYWLVSANGFDAQHFAHAHDRRLIGSPAVTSPHPLARRVTAEFEVVGRGWRDRLARAVAGPRVRLEATVWGGTLALVRSRTRRGVTFGLVEVRPAGAGTRVRVWIGVRRQPGARPLAGLRASFVRAFLAPDADLLQGAAYRPDRLTADDALLIDYFRWLAPATHATPTRDTSCPPSCSRCS